MRLLLICSEWPYFKWLPCCITKFFNYYLSFLRKQELKRHSLIGKILKGSQLGKVISILDLKKSQFGSINVTLRNFRKLIALFKWIPFGEPNTKLYGAITMKFKWASNSAIHAGRSFQLCHMFPLILG